jgi:hypothetical protein
VLQTDSDKDSLFFPKVNPHFARANCALHFLLITMSPVTIAFPCMHSRGRTWRGRQQLRLSSPAPPLPCTPPWTRLAASVAPHYRLVCIREERDCSFASPLSSKSIWLRGFCALLEHMTRVWRGKNVFNYYVEVSFRGNGIVSL